MENMAIRFFVEKIDENGDDTVEEVLEEVFLSFDGRIEYERHTVFENGVSQVCLTKTEE